MLDKNSVGLIFSISLNFFLFFGCLFLFLFNRALKVQKKDLIVEKKYLTENCSQLQIERAEQKERERHLIEKLQKEQSTQKEWELRLKDQFSLMAQQVLDQNSQNFYESAKHFLSHESNLIQKDLNHKEDQIKNILNPLKATLDVYQKQIHDLEQKRERSYEKVESELLRVAETQKTLSQTTSALKDALRKPHVRGRWGEIQLKNCIELAGMSEYADVEFQKTVITEQEILRPDMIVKMPGDHLVVVDAKTPVEAFIESLDASSEEERSTQMIRHGLHVKDHIKKLSSRAYAQVIPSTADFTVMFLPNESFLYAALESQPDLVEFALHKKILIATPPTLIGLLKVIQYGWNEEKLARNAEKIAEVGRELHSRMAQFVDVYLSMGKSLDKAKNDYDTGMMRLQQRILSQAKKLENLGAKSPKIIPYHQSMEEEFDEQPSL